MCVYPLTRQISLTTQTHYNFVLLFYFIFLLQFSLSEEDVACHARSSYEELTKAGCFNEIAPENDAHLTSQECLCDFWAAIIIFSSYM